VVFWGKPKSDPNDGGSLSICPSNAITRFPQKNPSPPLFDFHNSRHSNNPTHSQRRNPGRLKALLIHPHLRLLHSIASTLQPPRAPTSPLDGSIMGSNPVFHRERGLHGAQGVEYGEPAGSTMHDGTA